MTDRTFLIQRYCSGNWPKVKGQEPFIVTGRRFSQWMIKGSLDRYGEHRFVPRLKQEIDEVLAGVPEDLARECAASILLREEIVSAIWARHPDMHRCDRTCGESCAGGDWEKALKQVASEIPLGPIGEAVIELLSGMGGPEQVRSYLSEDEITLEPTLPIRDGL